MRKIQIDAIFFLSLCFLLSPIGNLGISLSLVGIHHWYHPQVMISMVKMLVVSDLVVNALIFLAGVVLFFRRKIAWTFAICVLAVVSVYNFYVLAISGVHGLLVHQTFLALFTSGSALFLVFRFRYPYLDRRDQWLSMNNRYDVAIDGNILEPQRRNVRLINISKKGALFHLYDRNSEFLKNGMMLTIQIHEHKFSAEVVRSSSDQFAVEFRDEPVRIKRIFDSLTQISLSLDS